jgi:tRNA uridine 5-carboxymethylaminomethyl modification enzyme
MAEVCVVIVGGGHAGVEAAWAASSALVATCAHGAPSDRARVVLVTMDASKIGAMSCNPAIGGLAKGQMVCEIDALGGVMGEVADATGIQFRVLNASKGAAVRGPRAQCDKHHYQAEVQRRIASRERSTVPIEVVEGVVERFVVREGRIAGVVLSDGASRVQADARSGAANDEAVARMHEGERCASVMARMPYGAMAAREPAPTTIATNACVLTTGTFMRALMHTGDRQTEGGRVGEGTAVGIAAALRDLGFELGRLKTGTPPRLVRGTIDWESLAPQWGDAPPTPFAMRGESSASFPRLPQVECRETATTRGIHDLVRANLDRAPMYAGAMEAESGPRYCPSLEDKVVRFPQRESHHVFLEPESLATDDIYCNGISTSLPEDVQALIVRGIKGCERAEVRRWGYAVEYDMVWPHQIDSTCETKLVRGLHLAGQINGTSGYEEAAAQGLVAGLNAARSAVGLPAARIGREQAYIGVLLDDLVTRQPREPYRMFTSRAEHRLLLRADNAQDRLTALGVEMGLVDRARAEGVARRGELLASLRRVMREAPAPALFGHGKRLEDVARRPEIVAGDLLALFPDSVPHDLRSLALVERAITDVRYEAYMPRQRAELRRVREAEHAEIPADLDVARVTGLCAEAVTVLARMRPKTLGQASRLAGMSPSDVSVLELAIRRRRASTPSA